MSEIFEENAIPATIRNATIGALVGGGISFLGKGLAFMGAGSLQAALIAAGVLTPVGLASSLVFYGVVATGTFLSVFIAMNANERAIEAVGDGIVEAYIKRLDTITKRRDEILRYLANNIKDPKKVASKKDDLKKLTEEMKLMSRRLYAQLSIKENMTEQQRAYIFRVASAGKKGKLSHIDIRNRN